MSGWDGHALLLGVSEALAAVAPKVYCRTLPGLSKFWASCPVTIFCSYMTPLRVQKQMQVNADALRFCSSDLLPDCIQSVFWEHCWFSFAVFHFVVINVTTVHFAWWKNALIPSTTDMKEQMSKGCHGPRMRLRSFTRSYMSIYRLSKILFMHKCKYTNLYKHIYICLRINTHTHIHSHTIEVTLEKITQAQSVISLAAWGHSFSVWDCLYFKVKL